MKENKNDRASFYIQTFGEFGIYLISGEKILDIGNLSPKQRLFISFLLNENLRSQKSRIINELWPDETNDLSNRYVKTLTRFRGLLDRHLLMVSVKPSVKAKDFLINMHDITCIAHAESDIADFFRCHREGSLYYSFKKDPVSAVHLYIRALSIVQQGEFLSMFETADSVRDYKVHVQYTAKSIVLMLIQLVNEIQGAAGEAIHAILSALPYIDGYEDPEIMNALSDLKSSKSKTNEPSALVLQHRRTSG